MAQAEVFSFEITDPAFGEASRLPYMPIALQVHGQSLSVSALLDTGSAVVEIRRAPRFLIERKAAGATGG